MDDLLRFPNAVRRDPRIAAWFSLTDPFRLMTREWFERMRGCGPDIRELLHDGCPVACVGDAPFGYVDAFRAHASVGFFHGAMLADPAGLLEGSGKRMRHVKLRPGKELDVAALSDLITAAYADIQRRLAKPNSGGLKKATSSTKQPKKAGASPSELIDAKIAAPADWRGKTLARIRALIKEADPDVVEEVKWRKPSNPAGVPVWEHDGIICTGETYKDKVKLTFARGAALADLSGLFNSSLDGNVRRAIDIREGDRINGNALKALVRAAVALNTGLPERSGPSPDAPARSAARPLRSRKKPKSA